MPRLQPFTLAALLGVAAVFPISGANAADPIAVNRVDPPSWWSSPTSQTITLLVEGSGLKDATVTSNHPGLTIGRAESPGGGSSLFVDVSIAASARPGPVTLTFSSDGKTATHAWTLVPKSTRAPDPLGPDDVIYLLMPDRFANGDPGNDAAEAVEPMHDRTNPHAYHGGDFAGLRKKLPYLKDLGVTAIWLTPVYENAPKWFHTKVDGNPRKYADFHGYSPVDFYDTNPRFGSKDEYRAMVDEAHALGLKVIQDQIVGYTGPQHRWVKAPPAPDWFHGPMENPISCTFKFEAAANPNGSAADRRALTDGWFFGILPDLNVRNERVQRQMIQQSLWWVETFQADAIRLDTYPMVDREFWRDWTKAQKALNPKMLAVGEAWVLDAPTLSFFQGGKSGWDGIDPGIESVFDFPLFGAMADVTANKGSATKLSKALAKDTLYPRPDLLVTFLGNHDTPKIADQPGVTPARHRLAAAFLLTSRGIPQISWGDEVNLGGHGDDRRSIPGAWPGDPRDAFTKEGRRDEENATFQAYRDLLRLRREHPALRTGSTRDVSATDTTYAYVREKDGDRVLVVLNFGTKPDRVTSGMTLETLWGEGKPANGSIEIPAERAAIFRVIAK